MQRNFGCQYMGYQCLGFLSLVLSLTMPGMAQEKKFQSVVEKGQELFRHKWTPQDERSKNGDGLGPMFNARSCAQCHPKGGGEGREFNVQLLSIRHKTGKKLTRIPEPLNRLMPFFEVGGEQTVILHKNSTDEAYNHARRELLDLNPPPNLPKHREKLWLNKQSKKRASQQATRVIKRYKEVELIVSERNTPALFGGDLIDRIPENEFHRLVKIQTQDRDGISGRVSVALDGNVGKFGWRGQTSSLAEFVKGACAAELGLQTPTQLQNQNPFAPQTTLPGFDMSLEDLDIMTTFVKSLERPVHRRDEDLSATTRFGKEIFRKVDCAKCHVENVGDVRGLYSDLLLHDMGKGLADPLPAMPEVEFFQRQVLSGGGGYFGSGIFTVTERRRKVSTNIMQEWRTPPLWGAAESAPYLHDGRAATFGDAIMLHGGEAQNSVAKFKRLSRSEQAALIHFLKSLRVKG